MYAITGWKAVCGRGFYDNFVKHKAVKTAFERWRNGEFYRSSNADGFTFGEVDWKPYYGKIGNNLFIENDAAYLVPLGVDDIFKTYFGPADYIETVNTPGLPYYAKQERMRFDKGVDMEAQTNPLIICTRPRAILKITQS
jgi:hypothetical protein